MKKIIMAMVTGFVLTSYGSVNVNWTASAGFYFNANPAVGILGDATGNSTIAQLMYSPDNTMDNITLAGIGDVNDVVWGTVNITENGVAGDFDDFAAFITNETRAYTAGWVYALIFQDNVINANDWYFYTPMLSLVDVVGATPAQDIEMNTDLVNGNAIDSGATVAQVVPEPATALLFGMGAMGAWLIRRNKIKSKEAADA